MDKKSSILLTILVILIFASVALSFYKYVIKRDYIIFATTACDPISESCFYAPCEEEDCPSEIEYYKKIEKKAANIPPLNCGPNEESCNITYCSEDSLEEGELCS